MPFKVIFLLLIICLPFAGYAQQKQFDIKPYLAGKSFTQVEEELIEPYFEKLKKQPIKYGKLNFSLWNMLPQSSRDYRANILKYNVSQMARIFSGASILIAEDKITLASGEVLFRPKHRNKDDNIWYSVSLANFDQGVGLMLDFTPLSYKVYFSPMTSTNIRIFTVSPYNQYWDKTYKELDKYQRKIKNPVYYYAALDAFIRGDFQIAKELPAWQQEVLVDSLAISIAEYYQGKMVHRKLYNPPRALRRDPASRMAPPFFNIMLAQYHNHRIEQIAKVGKNSNVDKHSMLFRARMSNYYNRSNYLPAHRYINEKIITKALTLSNPYEMSVLRKKLSNKYQDNYFDMLCYLVLMPELYDEELRFALRKIILSTQGDALYVSWLLREHLKTSE